MSDTLMTDGEQPQVTEGDTVKQSNGDEAAHVDKSESNHSTEAQASEESEASDPKGEEESKPEGAPEKYDFKQSELDDAVVDAYAEAAKTLDLSQDDAQKMLDTMAPVMAQRQAEQMQAVRDGWENEAKSDQEFGGDALNENLAIAKKAMDAFGTPELNTLLNETGLGNHPEIIRAFYRAGMKISEDTFVGGGNSPDQGNKTPAQRMYPGMNP